MPRLRSGAKDVRHEPDAVGVDAFAYAAERKAKLYGLAGKSIQGVIDNNGLVGKAVVPLSDATLPIRREVVQRELHIAEAVGSAGEDRAETVPFLDRELGIFAE